MDKNEFRDIIYERDEDTGIVTLTINRPEIRNALTVQVAFELHRAMETIETDDDAKAVIITGAKPPDSDDPMKEAFCSGGYFDPSELESMDEKIKEEIDFSDIAQKKLCVKMWEVDKPIIAAINGLAIGGGITIPLAGADLIYVSEHAWARFPFVSLGIIPELASSYLMPRLIGMQKTKEIFFFGEKIPARELFDLGLVNKVLPHDELLPFTRETALKLVPPKGAWMAVRETKKALHKPLMEAVKNALDLENKALNKTFSSNDFFEALAARSQKREPVFKGK